MSADNFAAAATAFMNRGRLSPGMVFVGRRRQFSELAGLDHETAVRSYWLSGPRQIGKSSLASRIELNSAKRIDLSLDGVEWKGVDGLCARIASDLGVPYSGFDPFFAHIKARPRPLIVVIDEFDGTAIQLGVDDQAPLRKLADKIDHFGWLFISRQLPTQLCQENIDVNSRLTGVCHPIRLPLLQRRDLQKLFEHAQSLTGNSLAPETVEWVASRVGGYPVVAQRMIAELLLDADERGAPRNAKELEDRDFNERVFFSVRDDLTHLWRDLPHQIRSYIRRGGVPDEETRGELLALEFPEQVPTWLLRASEAALGPAVSGAIGLAEQLAGWFLTLNEQHGQITFSAQDVGFKLFEIARPVKSEEELKALAAHLHAMCVDACRYDERSLTNADKRRLDQYRESAGYQVLLKLRTGQRDALRVLGGGEARTAQEWNRIQVKLLESVVQSLSRLGGG